MVAVDAVVVGGGVQGLVLLRELSAAGFGCVLVTNGPLGGAQTLHSHGLLNSGTGLVTGLLQDELHGFTLPYLRRLGVPVHGEDRSFLLLPEEAGARLAPGWQAHRYRPEPVDAAALPPGVEADVPVYRVRGFNVDKRRMVAALAAGLEPFVLQGDVLDATRGICVRDAGSGSAVALEPRAVVVAAGCGAKRLLREVFDVAGPVLDRIGYTKPHMICVRGPAAALAELGTVVSPELIVVGHAGHDAQAPGERLVTWYVTPAHPSAPRFLEAPDDAAAEVEPDVVGQGVQALVRLVPSLARHGGQVEATVFAGYKQDLDGDATRRACDVVDDDRNVLVALPSVLANAVPNAVDAVARLRERLGTPAHDPVVASTGSVPLGELNEHVSGTRWVGFRTFAEAHGVRMV